MFVSCCDDAPKLLADKVFGLKKPLWNSGSSRNYVPGFGSGLLVTFNILQALRTELEMFCPVLVGH